PQPAAPEAPPAAARAEGLTPATADSAPANAVPPPCSEEEHLRRLQQWCPPAAASRRRGQQQQAQRQRERAVRAQAAAVGQWGEQQGGTLPEVAGHLHLTARTLRQWRSDGQRPCPPPGLLGRPLARPPVAVRNTVIAWLEEAGPGVGLPALRQGFPELARAELEDLLRRYRRVWRWRHQRAVHVLHWPAAGAVWAMDFAEAPAPVEGRYPW